MGSRLPMRLDRVSVSGEVGCHRTCSVTHQELRLWDSRASTSRPPLLLLSEEAGLWLLPFPQLQVMWEQVRACDRAPQLQHARHSGFGNT